MKFSIRDLLLLVTLVAVSLWAFSGSNKFLGRHLVFASLAIAMTVFAGCLIRDRYEIRLRCAIGGFIGALIYWFIAYVQIDKLFDVPLGSRLNPIVDPQELFLARSHILWSEMMWLAPLALALGATVGPLVVIELRRHEPCENNQINRNISRVLLGLMALSYFMAVVDVWRGNYLKSHWISILSLVALVFVLFTFPWVGSHFKSLQSTAESTTNQPDATAESPSPEQQD